MISRIERALAWLALWSHRRAVWVLAAALILTMVAGYRARSLHLDADLTHLLPRSFESVQSLETLEERSWGVGYVSVVVQGGDQPGRRRLAEDLAPKLEALSTIQYVDFKRPTEFFTSRALLFMDSDDLRIVRDRLEERRIWEARKRSPLFDLDLEPLGDPPSLDFSEMEEKYQSLADRSDGTASTYIEAEDMLVLLARPSRRSSDVAFNDQVVKDVRGVVDAVELSKYHPAMRIELSGRYQKKAEQKAQIESDLSRASVLALVLMLGYLAFHFRRGAGVFLVLAPLLLGIVWAFGLTAAAFGSLNLLTGFIGALLLGVGIDHGIHLVDRLGHEQRDGRPLGPAQVARAFGSTGRAVVAAALTTIVAFLGVGLSEFRAFREFGIIAGAGLFAIVLAYTTVLPALVRFVGSASAPRKQTTSSFARRLPRWAPVTAWLVVLGAAAATSFIREARFDYDFAALEASDLPAFRLDRRINELLGRSQTPLVVMADDAEHERKIAAALRERISARGDNSNIQMVLALGDLVPAQTSEKVELVAGIHHILEKTKPSWLDEEQRRQRDDLLTASSGEPFRRAELPVEVRRQFIGRDGATSFVLVYPSVSLSDGEAVRALANELRGLDVDGERVVVAGEAMVLADVLDLVTDETPAVLGLTIALVLLVLLVLGGPSLVLPSAAAAGTTLLVTVGLLPVLGLSLNYLNIIVIPILFGMAVDGALHLLVRHREVGDVVAVTSETGRAVSGAILTTALGFGAFAMANHPGLQSLGRVAVLGLGVNLVVCLVLIPSGLALLERLRARSEDGGRWTRFAVTTGWAGESPLAPGTLGALVALPLGLAGQAWPFPLKAALAVVASAASIVVVARYLRRTHKKDPSEVVLDEFVGCLIAVFLVPAGFLWALAAFVLFRALDILKPWPVSFFDKRVRGAWGVMGDDIVAGLLAGVALLGLDRIGVGQGWWG